jgi:hypothetical protein
MESLFRARGDMHSGEIKQVKEVDSVKAELPLFVAEEDAPDLYKMAEDDAVEIGPFAVRLSMQRGAFMHVIPEAWLPACETTGEPFAVRPWALPVLSSCASAIPASTESLLHRKLLAAAGLPLQNESYE